MVETADGRHLVHGARLHRLHRATVRRVLVEREVRAVPRVVPKPTGRNQPAPSPPAAAELTPDELHDIRQAVEELAGSLW